MIQGVFAQFESKIGGGVIGPSGGTVPPSSATLFKHICNCTNFLFVEHGDGSMLDNSFAFL